MTGSPSGNGIQLSCVHIDLDRVGEVEEHVSRRLSAMLRRCEGRLEDGWPFPIRERLGELGRALNALQDCRTLHEIMGERLAQAYLAAKRTESNAYLRVISSWERQYLLPRI